MSEDLIAGKPWAKLTTETTTAYHAFLTYLEMGPKRSISKAVAAAGAPPSRSVHWRKWSSRHRWQERCAAFDAEEFRRRVAARREEITAVHQAYYDEIDAIAREYLDLARGIVRPGDQRPKLTRDGKPIMAPVRDPETGEIVDVAVADERVDPKTRARILEKVLAMCGLVAPTSTKLTLEDHHGSGIRDKLAEAEPETLAALADALGVPR